MAPPTDEDEPAAIPGAGVEPEGQRRPRDLAVLLLAVGTDPPRARARDQQADLAGGALRRRALDLLAALDPEPGGLDAALAAVVEGLGGPAGPARAVCSQIRQEWDNALAAPGYWGWLLAEALERSAVGRDRGRRKGRPGPDDGPEAPGGSRGTA